MTTEHDARVARLIELYGELDAEEIAQYLALDWDKPPATADELAKMPPSEREAALDDISARPMTNEEWAQARLSAAPPQRHRETQTPDGYKQWGKT